MDDNKEHTNGTNVNMAGQDHRASEQSGKYEDELIMSNDPRFPQNWPLTKKIFVSAGAWAFTFTLLNGLTSYAAAVPVVQKMYGVSMTEATLPFSLFLFGIFLAPLYTPHVSERVGRNAVYFTSAITMSAFLLGAAFSKSFTSLAATRFFAGMCGGPIVVNVEGTYADVWDAKHTVTYYSFLAAAQYMGASVGPIIAAPVVGGTGDWRYTQFIPLMFALASLLLGFGMPESYPRQILRNEARRNGQTANLSPAPTGTSIGRILKYTVFDPVFMFVSEPLVTLSGLLLAANFGLLFSLFIAVPPVLKKIYMLDNLHLGLGFLSGLSGSAMALITAPLLEQLFRPLHQKRVGMVQKGVAAIEYRLIPAMLGCALMIAGLFWVGNTASPKFVITVPVAGTAVYVWGSMLVLISIVSYVFDAYPTPQPILSALTAMATARVFAAGIVSLFFFTAVQNLGGPWAFEIFGIIVAVLAVWPVALFFLGPTLRSRSRWAKGGEGMSPMMAEADGSA